MFQAAMAASRRPLGEGVRWSGGEEGKESDMWRVRFWVSAGAEECRVWEGEVVVRLVQGAEGIGCVRTVMGILVEWGVD